MISKTTRTGPLHPAVLLGVLLGVLYGVDSVVNLTRLAGKHAAGWSLPHFNESALTLALAGVWLTRLPHRRVPWAAWPAWMCCATGTLLVGVTTQAALVAADLLVVAVTVWLTWAVVGDAVLSLRPPPDGRALLQRGAEAASLTLVSLAGLAVSGIAAAALAAWSAAPHQGTAQALGLTQAQLLVGALTAGVREEIPLTAALVLLLAAARWAPWQIYLLACGARVLPHLYLGAPALGVAVFAAVNVWLYRRGGRILPLAIAHTLINTINVLALGPAALAITVVVLALCAVAARQSPVRSAATRRPVP